MIVVELCRAPFNGRFGELSKTQKTKKKHNLHFTLGPESMKLARQKSAFALSRTWRINNQSREALRIDSLTLDTYLHIFRAEEEGGERYKVFCLWHSSHLRAMRKHSKTLSKCEQGHAAYFFAIWGGRARPSQNADQNAYVRLSGALAGRER